MKQKPTHIVLKLMAATWLCYNQISIFIVYITQLLWSVTKSINIKKEKLFSSSHSDKKKKKQGTQASDAKYNLAPY